jgi:hypothetical protein
MSAPISSYRLGDLCLLTLTASEKQQLVTDYPDSIGADYINLGCTNGAASIAQIISRRLPRFAALLPPEISESTVIHLRLGDVLAGNTQHEREKRPIPVDQLRTLVPPNSRKIYVIGKCFFAKTSSSNYDECIQASDRYFADVLRELGGIHFDGGSADVDLYAAVMAKQFIQGRGFFSKLITETRRHLFQHDIELDQPTL